VEKKEGEKSELSVESLFSRFPLLISSTWSIFLIILSFELSRKRQKRELQKEKQTQEKQRENIMGMKHCVAQAFLSLAMVLVQTRGGNEENLLLDPSTLEMFVDELPQMPKIKGYEIKNGVPVAGNLTIGIYDTTWVIDVLSVTLSSTFLIFSCMYDKRDILGFINFLFSLLRKGKGNICGKNKSEQK
jgi:hypothetical protein